jgi:hypothetical protein
VGAPDEVARIAEGERDDRGPEGEAGGEGRLIERLRDVVDGEGAIRRVLDRGEVAQDGLGRPRVAMLPRILAFAAAAANSAEVAEPIAARTIGCSMPRRSQSDVRNMRDSFRVGRWPGGAGR